VYEEERKNQALYNVPSSTIAAQQTIKKSLLFGIFEKGQKKT